MPPATLTPTARPVWRWKSRAASIMHRAPACVALEAIFPVEVLMKSAPAAMASMEALRTWSYDPSSPISRITFRCAVPQASLDRVISSNAWWYLPERNAERFSTMSISSAPHCTACRISSSRSWSGARPEGNPPATLATFTPVPRSRSAATGTSAGKTQTAATEEIVGSVGSGRTAFEHTAVTLPGVSAPSSVVRSAHRTARASAYRFDSRLIDRVPSEAARSSSPTASTGVTRTMAASAACGLHGDSGTCVLVSAGTLAITSFPRVLNDTPGPRTDPVCSGTDGPCADRPGAPPGSLRRGDRGPARVGVPHAGGHLRRGNPFPGAPGRGRVRGCHGHGQARGHHPPGRRRVRPGVPERARGAGDQAGEPRGQRAQLQRGGFGRRHRHPTGRDGPDRGDRRRGRAGDAHILLRVPPVPRDGGTDHHLRGGLSPLGFEAGGAGESP